MKFVSSSLLALCHMLASSLAAELTVDPWEIPASGDGYPFMEADVGDSITFTWTGTHNVQIHPSMSCDTTNAVMVGETSPITYQFQPQDGSPDGTPHFFASGVGDDCLAGTLCIEEISRLLATKPRGTISGDERKI
jgi:hypothetical protein